MSYYIMEFYICYNHHDIPTLKYILNLLCIYMYLPVYYIHSIGFNNTEKFLQLIVNCPITPDTWCRIQFNGDCFCILHNDTFSNSDFSASTSFPENGISLLVNQTEFRTTFAGNFIGCSVDGSILRAFHISGTYMYIEIYKYLYVIETLINYLI